MPVKVMIPTALRQFADDQDTMDMEAATVSEVMSQLGDRFPELKKHLFSDDGSVRNFVSVFLNEDNIRDLQQMDTAVKDGDELAIVPAVAGG